MSIYAVGLIKISTLRDKKLSGLFSEEESALGISDAEFLITKNQHLDKKLSDSTKVYKTIGGANRSINSLNFKYSNKKIRFTSGIYDPVTYKFIREFDFNTAIYQFFVIDVTQDWNNRIDDLIKKTEIEYVKKINKLKLKKVNG